MEHHHFFWVPCVLFFIVFGTFVVFRIIAFRQHRAGGWYGPSHPLYAPRPGVEAEQVLRKRLASGEIGEEEYRRLLDILKES